MIVTYILIAMFQSCPAVLHQAIKLIYWVGLTCIPLWLLVIGVSQTSLKVDGCRSKVLLAFSEAGGSHGNLWKCYCHYIILWRNFSLEALIGLSPKKWRNREGEPCMEKLIANEKWRFICHSLVPAVNIPEKTLLSVSCVGVSLIRSASFL